MAYRTSSDLAELRDVVRALAVKQGGVFRRLDLVAWDIDPTVVVAMLRRRWWARLHHGVYVDARDLAEANPAREHLLRCAAGILALDRPAFAFGPSGALIHGLPLPRHLPNTVGLIRQLGTDGRALRRRVSAADRLGDAAIRSHDLAAADTLCVGGVPVVARDIAAVSAAAECDDEWAVAILDAAAWKDPSALARLSQRADEYAHLRGIGTVRAALPMVRTGAQTPLESISRIRLTAHGLPEPRLQVPLFDSDGLIGYVDALWDDLGVVGEADGNVKYDAGGDVLIAEKRREDRIRALGHAVVRWGWREIMRSPAAVAGRIRAASQWSARRAG